MSDDAYPPISGDEMPEVYGNPISVSTVHGEWRFQTWDGQHCPMCGSHDLKDKGSWDKCQGCGAGIGPVDDPDAVPIDSWALRELHIIQQMDEIKANLSYVGQVVEVPEMPIDDLQGMALASVRRYRHLAVLGAELTNGINDHRGNPDAPCESCFAVAVNLRNLLEGFAVHA